MDSTTLFINVIGFVATMFSVFMWVPQARITWQNRNDPTRLAGVSETTQWLSMFGYLLWGVFGVLIGSLWVAAPSLVSFPLSIATIILVRRGRRLVSPTKTIPIISMSEPLAVIDPTGSVPILSTEPVSIVSTVSVSVLVSAKATAAGVSDRSTTGSFTSTTPIPVLA